MIKFISLISLLSLCSVSIAQPVNVKRVSEKVKGETMEGYAAELQGKRNEVNSTVTKTLKEHGKIKFLSTDPLVITNPVLNGTLYEKGILYAFSKENGSAVSIWIGRKAGDWSEAELETVDKQLEKLVYQTGIQFYRDEVQRDIDQTQQAIDAVDKQILRAANQAKDLAKKLVNNDLEKIKLEQAIEANKLEDAVLKVKIVNNKKAQDSLASALTHIQEMKKVHEEKMKKIN
jgi:hypothetical protein